jgi:hypothetical protein
MKNARQRRHCPADCLLLQAGAVDLPLAHQREPGQRVLRSRGLSESRVEQAFVALVSPRSKFGSSSMGLFGRKSNTAVTTAATAGETSAATTRVTPVGTPPETNAVTTEVTPAVTTAVTTQVTNSVASGVTAEAAEETGDVTPDAS